MTSLKTSIKTITYLSDIGCLEIQGASLISNNGFGFGPNGSLNLIASDAFSGSNNLDLALASGKNDNPGSTGTASISTSPNNWLVFMQNGQEVVIDSGKSVSLTLTMAPAFKDEGELTDMTDITGNLTVLVEAK